MVLAMSVHSRKTKVSLKEVENYTTKDRINCLIVTIRAIKDCLENQYLIDLFILRIYSLAVERRSPKPLALVRFQLDSLKIVTYALTIYTFLI